MEGLRWSKLFSSQAAYGRSIVFEPSLRDSRLSDDATYPLCVAYDGYALVKPDGGTGKGAQLRSLLYGVKPQFLALAPLLGSTNSAPPPSCDELFPLIQEGRTKYLIWQQTFLPRLLARIKPDVFLAPYNTAPLWIPARTQLITVVHDLILIEKFPGTPLKQRLKDLYRAKLLHRAVRRSRLIVTVSTFCARHIQQHYPNAKLFVIHCSIDSSWYVRGDAIPQSRREPYILMVTGLAPHKNVESAMQAFARFRDRNPRSGIKLRLVGLSTERNSFLFLANRLGLPGDSFIIEPFLSTSELQQLYRTALCAFFPSKMEGFGIPALEAMASGTALVCSDTWSLPEVGGEAPLYVDPGNTEEMATALVRVCDDPALREQLARKGLARAEVFHPERIREQVHLLWSALPEMYKAWKS